MTLMEETWTEGTVRLRAWVQEHGGYTELARLLGVRKQHVHLWCTGTRPRIDHAIRIEHATAVSVYSWGNPAVPS